MAPNDDIICSICTVQDEGDCVLCDECREPYHLKCVGEDESVKSREWFCPKCVAKISQRERSQPTTSSPSDESKPGSRTPTHRRDVMHEISMLFDQMKACMEKGNETLKVLPLEKQCYACSRTDAESMILCQKCDRYCHTSCLSESETRSFAAWKCAFCTVAKMRESANVVDHLINRLESLEQKMEANAISTRLSYGVPPSCSTAFGRPSGIGHELSQSQASARHTGATKLPCFSGNPEEWDMFISAFEETTRLCGFSDAENIIRLQQALKGKALKSVQLRLRKAENLEEVLESLRSSYGRPELIVNTLLDQIKNAPLPRMEKLDTLVSYAVTVEEISAAVRTGGLENRYDGPLLEELVGRLPPIIAFLWGMERLGKPLASLSDFGTWMKSAKEAALIASPSAARAEERKHARNVNVHTPVERTAQFEPAKCACDQRCNQLEYCEAFLQLSPNDRWKLVKGDHVCSICLRRHRNSCRVTRLCNKNGCTKKHHPLLHSPPAVEGQNENRYESNNSHSTGSHSAGEVLLRYIPVTLYGPKRALNTVALLDDGSSVTLMEHRLLKELGLKGETKPLCLSWTGGQNREENDSVETSIVISGTQSRDRRFEMRAVRTVGSLGLPSQSVKMLELSARYKYLQPLPLPSYDSATPRLIIGIDNYRLSRPLKTVEGNVNEPTATKTRLGWVVSGCFGNINGGLRQQIVSTHRLHPCECQDLEARVDAAMKGSFALEDVHSNNASAFMSKENERALALLHAQTKQIDGRYETALLWRFDKVKMPNNRNMALKRLDCLERRMERETQLRSTLNDKIKTYLEKGYARKLSMTERQTVCPKTWYLPIFPVVNPNKPGKVRIVWDAAAKFHGISLNSMLLIGPDLLSPLTSVLQRFREYRVAVAADIREMYHQVCVKKDDQNSQRFLWRWNKDQSEPDEYVMQRMTFGAACSPSSAQFVKNLNADRYAESFPRAVDCIKRDHYVDDMLISTETVMEAQTLAQQVTKIHGEGGFLLHNWLTNRPEVLDCTAESALTQKDLDICDTISTQKILGMWWDTRTDTFHFRSPAINSDLLQGKIMPTKRQVLQVLMRVFDPLGLIAGLLLYLKVLLQEVWRCGTGWDDPIPQELQGKWKEWIECLPHLETIAIPRCYRQYLPLENCNLQLHVFVDAGKDGLAAVAYYRYARNDDVEVALVGGKTRVAPLKYLSVPRLELQAAVVGTRLANSINNDHREKVARRFFWSDSKDVILWINSDHRRYSTFVAHRIGEILENTGTNEWHWVSSKLNVADEGTKWTKLSRHLTTSDWFKGPKFLSRPESEWPICTIDEQSTNEELRKTICVHTKEEAVFELDRFSRWLRLQRSIGYVWRFINNCKVPKADKRSRECGPLTMKELQFSEQSIIREVQKQAFHDEYITLLQARDNPGNKPCLPRSSKLHKRSPYMDPEGLLRVRGRIDACSFVSDETKRPIILPKSNYVTDLIIDHYHRKYRHMNHLTIMNEVRQIYDIPALRAACHRVRSKCQVCRIKDARPREPMMGDLPQCRLSPFTRPFTYTGIDYFGPFTVVNGRKSEKRWGVLFTCLTIRAVHIEIAHTLSTSSCILAIRNFIARRGAPNEIISDRGTNFVGASRELQEALKEIDASQIIDGINLTSTKWTFNPPAAPHFGGAWERLIQSVKRTLSSIQFTKYPSDAVFNSWLIEVEFIVNSRPLTDVPVDREEDAPLTPNHFLMGSSSGAKPITASPHHSTEMLKNTWRTSQIYADIFWRKWVSNYLPTLTRRTKWYNNVKPIIEGDIVLIIDETLPRGCWLKGRVVQVIVSNDGQVRRVHVKTASGKVLERPAVKIAVIDVSDK